MSKILIFANDYKTIANFRMELLERFLELGHKVTLSLPEDERNHVFTDMGCSVISAPITRHGTNPVAELKLIRVYKDQIKQAAPDCVLTFTVKPNIYASIAAAAKNVPYINNITGLGSVMQSESFLKKMMLRLQKYAYRKSACVFFQNEGNLRYFKERGIVGEQARLLPGSGVNLALHAFSEYPPERETTDIAIISRLRKDKGYDEFFAMMQKLLPRYPKLRFHIIGWVEEEAYREKLAQYEKEPRVIYHGELTQTQVHEVLQSCHCLCHPSYHEGMANVLMEAAAAGRPTLASDIPGCKEIIDDSLTGFTFRAQDADALTDAVERFLAMDESEHRKMGKKAREKMERELDREIVIRKYLEKIEAVTASKVGV